MALSSARPGTKAQTLLLALSCTALGALMMCAHDRWTSVGFPLGLGPPMDLLEEKPRPEGWWTDLHQQYVDAIAEADKGEGYKVIFYGEGITEGWQGTFQGKPVDRAKDVTVTFNATFAAPYGAAAFGIAGDGVDSLAWRLFHGELPTRNPPKVIVLNIGSNDLERARRSSPSPHQVEESIWKAVPHVTMRVLSTIRRIRDLLPDTVVVLQAVLPRGVDGPDPFRLPNLFTWPLYVVNEHLSHFASEDDNVQFVDCEDHVLTNEGSLDPAALPDGVHPSAPAYQHISRCLDILIGVLVEDPLAGRA
ncbi:hypothetical protein ACKKBF_B33690 [Auxenochlorella protothecoides x Auxenochlorella symbiontica]